LRYNQNLPFFVPKAKPFSRFREHSPIKSWCIPLLTNTTERYIRGGDATLYQITSTTCILRKYGRYQKKRQYPSCRGRD